MSAENPFAKNDALASDIENQKKAIEEQSARLAAMKAKLDTASTVIGAAASEQKMQAEDAALEMMKQGMSDGKEALDKLKEAAKEAPKAKKQPTAGELAARQDALRRQKMADKLQSDEQIAKLRERIAANLPPPSLRNAA